MGPIGTLQHILKQHGQSYTKPRLRVFEVLASYSEPASMQQLQAALPDIDKVSIYRTIDVFEKAGIITRIWNGFKSKIELSEQFSPHHHHFTCLACGKSIALEDETLEKDLKGIADRHRLKLTRHTVELSGYCQQCQ